MTRIVIAGAGMAGLATALLAARHGHEVVLVERDPGGPAGGSDEVFGTWERPGVPHARHSHKFLGLSCRILASEAPDVLDALDAAGARRVPISRFGLSPDHPDEFALAARRLVYEAVLRRAVERQPGVQLLLGQPVTGLSVDNPDGVPVVRGARLRDGRELPADLVVDATGRRCRLLAALPGPPPPAPQVQRCGFVYLTRHYRLHPGHDFPPLDRPLAINLGYAAMLAFPADSGTFSLSVTLATSDPCRQALRRPDVWDRFIAAVPHTARWAALGEPFGGVHVMSGISNRWQRLVDGDQPVVGGLVLAGDAALETNPTYGRGVSMALAHARRLAHTAGDAPTDPVAFVAGFEDWTAEHLGVWFRTQQTADAAAVARIEAGLRGERPPAPTDPFSRIMAAVESLSATDALVARALGRMAHLLSTPTELLGNEEVMRRATAHLRAGGAETPAEGPSRAEFEAIAAPVRPAVTSRRTT